MLVSALDALVATESITVDSVSLHSDGRRIKDQHVDKVRDFMERKVDKIRSPIVKLLSKRGVL